MKFNIAFFTSDIFGIKILRFLKKQTNLKITFFVSRDNTKLISYIKKNNYDFRINYYEILLTQNGIKNFQKKKYDFIISAYFKKC